jgi:hypothetical protein
VPCRSYEQLRRGIASKNLESGDPPDELDVARRRKTGAAGARDRTGCTHGTGPACTLPHAGSASLITPLVDETVSDRVDRSGVPRRLFRGVASHEIPAWKCPLGNQTPINSSLIQAIPGSRVSESLKAPGGWVYERPFSTPTILWVPGFPWVPGSHIPWIADDLMGVWIPASGQPARGQIGT